MIPLNGYVMLEPINPPSQSAGGIVYPDSAKNKTNKGKVLACGDAANKVFIGNTVLFSQYAPVELDNDGKVVWFVKAQDIIAVL